MPENNTTEREVPTKYCEQLTLQSVKGLTLKERFRLILGYNVKFTATILTQHRAGKTTQFTKVELTKDLPDKKPENRTVFLN